MIAKDHAPHSEEAKARPLQQAPSGIIGLETALGLAITNLVRPGHLSLLQLMEKMSLNPAKLYHLDSGSVEEGKAADLVLFDPDVYKRQKLEYVESGVKYGYRRFGPGELENEVIIVRIISIC